MWGQSYLSPHVYTAPKQRLICQDIAVPDSKGIFAGICVGRGDKSNDRTLSRLVSGIRFLQSSAAVVPDAFGQSPRICRSVVGEIETEMSRTRWPWNLSNTELRQMVEGLLHANPRAGHVIQDIAARGVETESASLGKHNNCGYDPPHVPYMLGEEPQDERRA